MVDADLGLLRVDVVLALPREARRVSLQLSAGSTVGEAVARSGLLGGDWAGAGDMGFGVFGERRELAALLRDGDRVEIYRPLTADPKLARRQRAKQGPVRS